VAEPLFPGIDGVNALDEVRFVEVFGHVYEDTPSLAALAWRHRPFADLDALAVAFGAVTASLAEDGELALLRAHPPLAAGGPMGKASSGEQRAAGLTAADRDGDLVAAIRQGSREYSERFGFPFVIAVTGLGPAAIVTALRERLGHDPAEERAEAMRQVRRIAELRLGRLVAG
jgi:2-oxo-4-hydroxy-4-carboxy-5-ureidoimidazoline decarboxylase